MKKLSILIMLIMCSSLSLVAKSAFVVKDVKIVDENKDVVAFITKGTKVEVLSNKSGKSLVKILGWSYEEEPNTEIYYDVGVVVELANIKESKVGLRKIAEKKPDINGDIWFKNSIEGYVNSDILSTNFKDMWNKEIVFITARCGACHSEPKVKDYTAIQFPGLINAMKDTAGMSDKEESFVINYYQKNRLYGSKEN